VSSGDAPARTTSRPFGGPPVSLAALVGRAAAPWHL